MRTVSDGETTVLTNIVGSMRAALRERMAGRCLHCNGVIPTVTVTQVARETGIPRSTIYRFLCETPITSTHLDRLARWLYQ